MTQAPENAALSAAAREGNGPSSPPEIAPENDGGLSLPTSELMALGGDARITLDEASGLNSYGCAPKPMPAITYASSTASTVSSGAFAQARAFHLQLRQAAKTKPAHQVYADAMADAHRRLCILYGLDASSDIAFGPSGTDLEYLANAVALASGQPVRNIVVEVDEVGSGCLHAQKAHYFAPRTALGLDVNTGEPVPGFPAERLVTETVTIRNRDGSLRDPAERESALIALLDRSVAAGERPLLHVIHRSKTGLIAPDPQSLGRLAARFGDRIDIVVDACQGRISPRMLGDYLALGAIIFVTGSKFIGGPPFSAFAIMPERIGQRMRSGRAPEGLGGFFARGEMPAHWASVDGVLPEVANFGLLLRLECGIFELSRLLAYPEEVVRKAIVAFGEAVRTVPAYATLQLLPGTEAEGEDDLHPLDRTMLHTFELAATHPVSGRALDIDDARAVYTMLFTDLSDQFTDPEERIIAAETCHVGQPVRCARRADGTWIPTLRLSLSAPHISEVAGLDDEALLRRFVTDLDWICTKIRLVLPLLPAEKPAAGV
jgi:hypothetical protein